MLSDVPHDGRMREDFGWQRAGRRTGRRSGRSERTGDSLPVVAAPLLLLAVIAGWSAAGRFGGVAPPAGSGGATRHFTMCFMGGGTNCVVDGDTFWMDGTKIRIADIDAPETHPPRCAEEGALGDRATDRLQALLNAGPVTLATADRDEDRYGRKLRIVERGGVSLGETLVAEGLARRWTGHRMPWCGVV